jgi:hypothetical protein
VQTGRLALGKGEGKREGRLQANRPEPDREIQPLTLMLSLVPRGEATRAPSRTDLASESLTNDVISSEPKNIPVTCAVRDWSGIIRDSSLRSE